MSIRSDLITQITSNLSGQSNISISEELPFDSGGTPLYEKNMNVIYVDEQDIVVEQLYRTLDQSNVNTSSTNVTAYMAVDAKNQFANINTVVANILLARNTISNTITSESDYETDIEDDVITYTFEYNFTTI